MFERFFKKKETPGTQNKAEPTPEDTPNHLPEDKSSLSRLSESIGWVPEEILCLYRNQESLDEDSPARLMAVDEVLRTNADLISAGYVWAGPICWFWTDDNSNYCGVFTAGPLKSWVTCLNHDEPNLFPAFRSVKGFLSRVADPEDACDIPTLRADLPATGPDGTHAESDRVLATHFRGLYELEQDDDKKRHFAMCSICLTPVENTADVLAFLESSDMWTPGRAIRLLELRRYEGAIVELEKLAVDGRPNGDGAAMRHLVRLGSEPAKQAVARLKQKLSGQKLQTLDMFQRVRLLPPRWP